MFSYFVTASLERWDCSMNYDFGFHRDAICERLQKENNLCDEILDWILTKKNKSKMKMCSRLRPLQTTDHKNKIKRREMCDNNLQHNSQFIRCWSIILMHCCTSDVELKSVLIAKKVGGKNWKNVLRIWRFDVSVPR